MTREFDLEKRTTEFGKAKHVEKPGFPIKLGMSIHQPHSRLDRESITKMSAHYVYILASQYHGTLYIGTTRELLGRVHQHKNGLIEGFTKKYNVHLLVYFERYEKAEDAINREKRMKKWNRQWKIDLIERENPDWKDLYEGLVDSQSSWE